MRQPSKCPRRQNDGKQKAGTLNELFRVLKDVDIDQALVYLRQELSLAEKLNDPDALGDAHYNFGLCFDRKEQKDSALVHFQKAKNFREEAGTRPSW